MSHEDEMARLRAEMDQAKEGMKEIAGACWAFYSSLSEEGFEPGQSLQITIAWLSTLLGKSGEAGD